MTDSTKRTASKRYGKGGRPRVPVEEQRTAQITCRLTEDERAAAEAAAREAGLSLTDFVRQKITTGRVTPRRSAADAQLLHELNRAGVNIHQIVRAVNFKQPVMDHEIAAVIRQHSAVLEKVASAYGS